MKDITHYFADISKKTSSSPSSNEFKVEREKADDATVVANGELKTKRKRGKVRITCDSDSAKERIIPKTASEYNIPDKTLLSITENKNKDGSLRKHHLKNSIAKGHISVANDKLVNDEETNTKDNKPEMTYSAHTEKVIKVSNKQKNSKRKVLKEDKADKKTIDVEKKLEENCVSIESDKINEESNRKSDISSTKSPGNLLNYFSKATPEQLEKEHIRNSKITVKAEIHTSQISSITPTFTSIVSSNHNKKSKRRIRSNSVELKEEFDKIHILQSEYLVLSENEEKMKSPTHQNKPKWSLKIQLQTNNNITAPDEIDSDDNEMYTPTAPLKTNKENLKSNEKIPKILLPLKSKKRDSSNSPLDDSFSKNKNEDRNNLKNCNITLKTEKMKAEFDEKSIEDCLSMEQSDSCDIIFEKELKENECKPIKYNSSKRKTADDNECIPIKYNSSKRKTADDNECVPVKDNGLKRKPVEKLAPLFIKKPKPNPEIISAQQLFLQSDISEKDNKKQSKSITNVLPFPMLPFPKVSHVAQLLKSSNISDQIYSFSLIHKKKMKPTLKSLHIKSVLNFNNATNNTDISYECVKANIDNTLLEIESYYTDVQTLWKFVSKLSKSEYCKPTSKTRQKTSDTKNHKLFNNDEQNKLFNCLWTDKYKPNSSAEVVGNEEAASKLKSWLESWKLLKNTDGYSSSEEFYTSDCSNSSNTENNQVAVLIGPHGSGKSASIYAVAHELGYKVLEVNASSKRPGKKILKDFEEATKSHRIKKSSLKESFMPFSQSKDKIKISQNSLILMEDVDLVFEEDEGFVSAVFQLASNSKRPIVLTLRDTCSYLPKLAPHQYQIIFQPVSGKRVSALLQLIVLAETGWKVSQECINAVGSNGDLRNMLLQLQFLLSGKQTISSTTLAINQPSWNKMSIDFYKPAVKAIKSKRKKKNSCDVLDNLVNNLDYFAFISSLTNIEDPTCPSLDLKSEPNISFTENTLPYSSLTYNSIEIGDWLNTTLKKTSLTLTDSKKLNSYVDTNNLLITKKQINIAVDYTLSQIASNTTDRHALATDYLPSIRTICRAEEVRSQLNRKRGNRFFHYLQSSKLSNTTVRSGNVFSTACKMLQENTIKVTEM